MIQERLGLSRNGAGAGATFDVSLLRRTWATGKAREG
jgi:hypothetical protein